MEGGPSKINPPNGHPSNQMHKAATANQKKLASGQGLQKVEPATSDKTSQHEINKKAVIFSMVGVTVLLFMTWR